MIQKNPKAAEREISNLLKTYERSYPHALTKSYRYSSGSIRIRIIDPQFTEMSRIERNNHFWKCMRELTDESHSQISLVVLIAPEEADSSTVNFEFEHPDPPAF